MSVSGTVSVKGLGVCGTDYPVYDTIPDTRVGGTNYLLYQTQRAVWKLRFIKQQQTKAAARKKYKLSRPTVKTTFCTVILPLELNGCPPVVSALM